MRTFSAFLQMFRCASVAAMSRPDHRPLRPMVRGSDGRFVEGHADRSAISPQGTGNTWKHRKVTRRKSGVLCAAFALTGPVLLAACGFNGTDRDKDDAQAPQQQAAAPADPDLAGFEQVDMADSEPRPQMQLQIVLDQRGFGPGVIDGKEGISTANALKGFQEANGLPVTGKADEATRQALAQWRDVPATRVVRIPENWGEIEYQPVPDEPEDQAQMKRLGYESLDEKLAERFHTTVEVLEQLNPGGRPAGAPAGDETEATAGTANLAAGGVATAQGNAAAAGRDAKPAADATAAADSDPQPAFRPGQLVRVPNVGLDARPPAAAGGDEQDWQRTLASLGVADDQPAVARVVVDKSEGWLKGYDEADKLVAMFTVTSGSEHDPLPLGDWKILAVSKNPPFHYNPDLFWDADASDEKATLPPGPNGPVGVVWIDLSKEHYGIHGTPEPQTIGRTQSHGCVRLTNWDAARLAGMVSTSTKVVFQA